MRILNLTQHVATAPQLAAGVVEPDAETKGRIRELLTFTMKKAEEDASSLDSHRNRL